MISRMKEQAGIRGHSLTEHQERLGAGRDKKLFRLLIEDVKAELAGLRLSEDV